MFGIFCLKDYQKIQDLELSTSHNAGGVLRLVSFDDHCAEDASPSSFWSMGASGKNGEGV